MSLKDKLNRMKVHLHIPVSNTVDTKVKKDPTVKIPFLKEWNLLQAYPFHYQDDYVIVREVRYPQTKLHGKYQFSELDEVIKAWQELGVKHPLSSANLKASDLLFFDTETTGLHGGVGNTIFLLGYSRFEEDSIVVRQHFLINPTSEITLYQSFLNDIHESKQLVTYNGKAFDWPQVKTRHLLIRDQVPQLPKFEHYDLLHGARRLWKHDLESCKLSLVEKYKLAITRNHDVPGYLAPTLYFEFLRNQDPEIIKGVLQHNEIDVLSLITLYIHISKLLIDYRSVHSTYEELYEVSRWYEALGIDDLAMDGYSLIAESTHPLNQKAKWELGHLFKKQKKWNETRKIWEDLIHEVEYPTEEICIELAKLYEHQFKEYDKSLEYSLRAYDVWKRKASLLRGKSKVEQEAYEKRILRLQNRIDQM